MNGGYGDGRGGRRPASGDREPAGRDPRGGNGYGGQGQGRGQEYDGRGQARPRSGGQPRWDASAGQPGQPGQPSGRPGQPRGQGGQGGQGYPPGGQGYGPRTGPQPGMPGTGRRGSSPQQDPRGYERGYDPRGTGPRRADDGYPPEGYPPRDPQFRQGGYPGRDPNQPDESFLPGFGGQGGQGGQGGRYPDDQGPYEDGRRRRPGRGRGGRQDAYDPGRDPYEPAAYPRAHEDRDDWDPRPRRKRGVVRRLAPWVALLVILTPLLIGGLYVYHIYENKYHPADYAGAGTSPTVTVEVNSGDTAFSLGPRLVQLGVVASSRAFELAAEHATGTAGLEVGFYKMNHHMQASLAYAALLNPKNRVQLTLTFPEGLRASQIVALLGARSGIPAGDYRKVLADPAQLGLPSYARGKPEGYLFPATYQIQPNDTALTVLKAMVQRFDQEAAQVKLPAAAAGVHMTPTQLIVVASLVQAEGGRVKDYPKIARVVYNRLARGMKLEFDSTVFYGLGKYGTAATDAEINTPGPYNTYLNTGLPPGAIDNPGNAAIEAALHPAVGNWLYFFSFKNGVTEFSPSPIAH